MATPEQANTADHRAIDLLTTPEQGRRVAQRIDDMPLLNANGNADPASNDAAKQRTTAIAAGAELPGSLSMNGNITSPPAVPSGQAPPPEAAAQSMQPGGNNAASVLMLLNCGCTISCCGICTLAEAAGRPRLTRDNAAEWEPPNLNKLRGAKHRAERDAEDGVPSLWYWQMEGMRWGLDGESFDVAKRAYVRLAASQEERSKESGKRVARELNKDSPEAVASLRLPPSSHLRKARLEEEAELAEERARRWRELRPVLRRCGLERLASGLESLRDSSVLSALYEPPASCAPHGWSCVPDGCASLGLLQCLDAFLICEDGGTRSEVEAAAAGHVAGLGLTKSEAASLHRTLVLARFERFVEAALTALNMTALSSPSEGGCACVQARVRAWGGRARARVRRGACARVGRGGARARVRARARTQA